MSGVPDRTLPSSARRPVIRIRDHEITRRRGSTGRRRRSAIRRRINGTTTYRFYAIKTSNDRGRATRERARTYTRRVYYRYNFRCPATSPPVISVMCQPAGIGMVVPAVPSRPHRAALDACINGERSRGILNAASPSLGTGHLRSLGIREFRDGTTRRAASTSSRHYFFSSRATKTGRSLTTELIAW